MADQQQNTLAIIKRDTADVVAAKVNQLQQNGELALPRNYSAPNALKSAWLMLQTVKDTSNNLALHTCTKDSIYNSLLDMVVQGLNPAKKQCYFIAYGNQLGCQRSYFGDEYMARGVRPDVDIYYQVIYEGDEFEMAIERGKFRVTKHTQKFGDIDPAKIRGAYCVIEDQDGRIVNSAVMTLAQIKQSWRKSKTYKEGGNSFHTEQPDQACLRTVIRRCCKPVINSSTDEWILAAVQREEMTAELEADADAAANANGEIVDITPESVTDEPAGPAPALETPVAINAQTQPTAAAGPPTTPRQAAPKAAREPAMAGAAQATFNPAAAGPGY